MQNRFKLDKMSKFRLITKSDQNNQLHHPLKSQSFWVINRLVENDVMTYDIITVLKAHKWQKWKSTFPTYPCHEICKGEAVGVKSYKYT